MSRSHRRHWHPLTLRGRVVPPARHAARRHHHCYWNGGGRVESRYAARAVVVPDTIYDVALWAISLASSEPACTRRHLARGLFRTRRRPDSPSRIWRAAASDLGRCVALGALGASIGVKRQGAKFLVHCRLVGPRATRCPGHRSVGELVQPELPTDDPAGAFRIDAAHACGLPGR